jgi:hypothetical protein
MNSSIIGKIDKARRYAEEKDRVAITSLRSTFKGDHNQYDVSLDAGNWNCQCHFFSTRGVCSHIMALQKILEEMLTTQPEAVQAT